MENFDGSFVFVKSIKGDSKRITPPNQLMRRENRNMANLSLYSYFIIYFPKHFLLTNFEKFSFKQQEIITTMQSLH